MQALRERYEKFAMTLIVSFKTAPHGELQTNLPLYKIIHVSTLLQHRQYILVLLMAYNVEVLLTLHMLLPNC